MEPKTCFLARGENLAAILKDGLTVESDRLGRFCVVPVLATDDARQIGVADAVILAVKGYDLEQSCRQIAPMVGPATVVLPLLKSDLLTIMQATTNGTLDKTEVKFRDGAAACVVLASGGYPVAYEKGKEITGLTEGQLPDASEVTVYHAGTAVKDGKLVTAGGRVLGVTATGDTLPQALDKAYAAARRIHFEGAHMRSDIGRRALAALSEN